MSGQVEVARWYTRARRFPQLVGRFTDGRPIPGGPYTYTQVGVLVATVFLGSKTTWLWGHFGTVFNAAILFGVAYAGALLVGRAPIGGRNPLLLSGWAVRALSRPSTGTVDGRPVRVSRPHHVRGGCAIQHRDTVTSEPPTEAGAREAPAGELAPVRPRPAPSPAVAASSLQRLLQSRGT